jgi:hypothetical protein
MLRQPLFHALLTLLILAAAVLLASLIPAESAALAAPAAPAAPATLPDGSLWAIGGAI